jgi:type IV pilus assembly protein PilB
MIVSTGPTGSGKTTTLYTLIKKLNTSDTSIVTIEDPIEYAISGIKQINVNQRTGLTFAHGLRSILRQDPNIIMVGEIRDKETARIAVNTALTGHVLLSTMHTNDAATTIPRFIDLHIEPFLIASTVNTIISQRLVRKNCDMCKEEFSLSKAAHKQLSEVLENNLISSFFEGKGCEHCNYTGYRGRIGIHELLVIDSDLRDLITQKSNAKEIKKQAIKNGMVTIIEDGLQKVALGQTSLKEVLKLVHE